MAAGAEIRLLRDSGAFSDLNFTQAISVGAVAEAGAIAQSEVPGDGNAGALMHERFAFDLRAKNIEPEETPRVGGLRRPNAKGEPAKFPEQAQRPVAGRPGRFLRDALVRP